MNMDPLYDKAGFHMSCFMTRKRKERSCQNTVMKISET